MALISNWTLDRAPGIVGYGLAGLPPPLLTPGPARVVDNQILVDASSDGSVFVGLDGNGYLASWTRNPWVKTVISTTGSGICISPDGTIVAGSDGGLPSTWTIAGTKTTLPNATGGTGGQVNEVISATEGVGGANKAWGQTPVLWNGGATPVELSTDFAGVASCCDSEGTTVFFYGNASRGAGAIGAFRWTPLIITSLNLGPGVNVLVSDCTSDGLTSFGWITSPSGASYPVSWDSSGNLTFLQTAPFPSLGQPNSVYCSDDGSVVVTALADANSGMTYAYYVWKNGITNPPILFYRNRSTIYNISGDGKFVVGTLGFKTPLETAYWDLSGIP